MVFFSGGLMTVKRFSLIAGIFFASIPVSSQITQRPNYLPVIERQENQIIVKIRPFKIEGAYFINYRTEGMKNYQIRKMQADSTGIVYYSIPTENLFGKNIEYFVAEKRGNGSFSISLVHTIANFTQKIPRRSISKTMKFPHRKAAKGKHSSM